MRTADLVRPTVAELKVASTRTSCGLNLNCHRSDIYGTACHSLERSHRHHYTRLWAEKMWRYGRVVTPRASPDLMEGDSGLHQNKSRKMYALRCLALAQVTVYTRIPSPGV
jgi:hypothetical protein